MDKKKVVMVVCAVVLSAVGYFLGPDMVKMVRDEAQTAPVVTDTEVLTSE